VYLNPRAWPCQRQAIEPHFTPLFCLRAFVLARPLDDKLSYRVVVHPAGLARSLASRLFRRFPLARSDRGLIFVLLPVSLLGHTDLAPYSTLLVSTTDELQPQRPRTQDLCALVWRLVFGNLDSSGLSCGNKLEPRPRRPHVKAVGHPRLSVLPLTVVCLVFGTRYFP